MNSGRTELRPVFHQYQTTTSTAASSAEFIQRFWKSPSVFLRALFPYDPLSSELLFYSFVKTVISFLKVEREITAFNSLHFLGDFSSFLKIYGIYLFPFLN